MSGVYGNVEKAMLMVEEGDYQNMMTIGAKDAPEVHFLDLLRGQQSCRRQLSFVDHRREGGNPHRDEVQRARMKGPPNPQKKKIRGLSKWRILTQWSSRKGMKWPIPEESSQEPHFRTPTIPQFPEMA